MRASIIIPHTTIMKLVIIIVLIAPVLQFHPSMIELQPGNVLDVWHQEEIYKYI